MSDITEEKGSNPYDKWGKEIASAKKWFKKFHTRGKKVNQAFLDDHKDESETPANLVTRLNLFHSNIITLMSMLYGRVPKVEVSRRFADADDDIGRIAGEILTRILNTDIEVAGEDIASVFRSCLQDRLIPGMGSARVQYHYSAEENTDEPIIDEDTGEEREPEEQITDEWTDIVYTHWQDILWSPARTYPELRWKAYRSYLSKAKLKARFSKIKLDKVNFSSKGALGKGKDIDQIDESAEVEVWEIWDKETFKVHHFIEGYGALLDSVEDPLELEGFWPDPPPLIANITTSKYLPKADYDIAADLYREIDELETRITLLTQACKCVGVYDKNNLEVGRIFNEGVENQLIPVANWAQFSEKGGLEGSIDWVPLEDVVNTIKILTEKQNDKIQQLMQVTGMNDVMRGAAMQEGTPVSATERKIQANYGSIRIEALQNEFARWVSDTQSLKAEIIGKHYQPYCIRQQSNIDATMDASDEQAEQKIQAAIELIKDPSKSRWRITVRPETLAIADYAQLKADRLEFIMGLAQFLQSAAPVLEIEPGAMPTLMKLLKWGLAGFRGSSEVEGIIDQEIDKLEKQPPQQKPDPEAKKAEMEMQKMQGEMSMAREEHQAQMSLQKQKGDLEVQQMQQKFVLEMKKMQMELQQMMMEFKMKMQELNANLAFKAQEQKIEVQGQQEEQAAQFAFNTAEREHEAQVQNESGDAELGRDRERAEIERKSDDNSGST